MKIKKPTRYILAIILILIMLGIIGSLVLRYHIKPTEIYYIDKNNLVQDGSFEEFNQTPSDYCSGREGKADIFASKSEDSIDGRYSLKLTSKNHCAVISKKVSSFDITKKYIISFYYKGNNPQFCNFVSGYENCIPNKYFGLTLNWTKFNYIIKFIFFFCYYQKD